MGPLLSQKGFISADLKTYHAVAILPIGGRPGQH